MKAIICITLVAIMTCVALPVFAAQPDFVDVRKNVDSATFLAAVHTKGVSTLYYIVDRTIGMCFVAWESGPAGAPGGLVKIDCEPLKKIDTIKAYIETGKMP